MAFSRVKVSGWAYGEIFTSAQANQLDVDHANAIDGAAGGTYNLSAPIVINGDDVTIGENLVVNDTLTTAALVVASVAELPNGTSVNGDLVVDDDLTVADTLSVANGATVGRLTTAGVVSAGAYVEPTGTVAPGGSIALTSYTNIIVSVAATNSTTLTSSSPATDQVCWLCNNSGAIQNFTGAITLNNMPAGAVYKLRYNGAAWAAFMVLGP